MFSRKSSKFLAYFTILISVGTLGFYVIGGDEWSLIDSFYMTLFTMTTVGFGEVHPLNDLGRLWTSFVIVFGVSGFLYMLSEIGAELVEFRVYKENQKKRKMSWISRIWIWIITRIKWKMTQFFWKMNQILIPLQMLALNQLKRVKNNFNFYN